MIGDIQHLREPLLAARLLREEILAMPVPPAVAATLRDDVLRRGTAPPASRPAILVAARVGCDPAFQEVTDEALHAVAAAAGGVGLRVGPGEPFHGRAAPDPEEVPSLYREILDTANAPRAVEVWSPPVRAFVLHFLLRLVQPFDGPAVAIAHAAEALVLASDGFDPRLVPMASPDAVGTPLHGRPDPPSFVLARAHALVEALGQGRDLLRPACAFAQLELWASDPRSGWNARRLRFATWLHETGRSASLRDYVEFQRGRRAPGLRTLQRDWRAFVEGGWLVPQGAAFALSTAPLTWAVLGCS